MMDLPEDYMKPILYVIKQVPGAIPGGQPPCNLGHLWKQLWQTLFKTPWVELKYFNKCPNLSGRAVFQKKKTMQFPEKEWEG